jgi:GNAT superfamily N-acetyltransferase
MAVIREASPQDKAAVFGLACALATSFPVERAAFDRSFDAVLTAPSTRLTVAESQEAVIGYVLGIAHPAFYANGQVAWVEEIFVQEAHRKEGIGRLLMSDFEAWADRQGCRVVALATRRAASFYQAIGYAESAAYFRKLLPSDPAV